MTPLVAATIPDVVTFALCAAVVLSGGVGVVTSRNAVHAALSLVATLFGIAVLFIEQHAYFLAAVQVVVYAGAIVVLFLFVIMFLGVDKSKHPHVEPLVGQRWFAGLGVAITVAGVIYLMANSHWVSGVLSASTGGTALATGAGNVTQLGDSVFTTYLLAFEATAGLLIIAVVGAVLLARRERTAEVDDVDDDVEETAADAGRFDEDVASQEVES